MKFSGKSSYWLSTELDSLRDRYTRVLRQLPAAEHVDRSQREGLETMRALAEAMARLPTTKYGNRLSREEAAQILSIGQSVPMFRDAAASPSHPLHDAVTLFRDYARYYRDEHPQAADGEPENWPHRAARAKPSDDAPFAGLHQDEAEVAIRLARSRDDFMQAWRNKDDPRHGEAIHELEMLHEIAYAPEPSASPADGPPAADVQARVDALMKDPEFVKAWQSRTAPGHDAAVEKYLSAFQEGSPTPAMPGASPSPASAAPAPAAGAKPGKDTRSPQEIMRNPAFMDKNHAGHQAALDAYVAAHAEPAVPEGGAT
jgi:hypothetical protein